MTRVRNYRSRFIAPLVAGALVLTPLGISTIPAAAAEEAAADSSTSQGETAVVQTPESQEEPASETSAASGGDDSAATALTTEQAPVTPVAPAEAPAPAVATALAAAVTHTIADARGLADNAPVTVHGVVTATYPTGGLNGFVIQTEGTGGDNKTEGKSDAIFVHQYDNTVAVGDFLEVSGVVKDYYGLKQISAKTGSGPIPLVVTPLTETPDPVLPIDIDWPATDAERMEYQSMLYMPTADFTVSETYNANLYGEIGLAFGDKPLRQPTDVALPGSPEMNAVLELNKELGLILDDGATYDFRSKANKPKILPYVSLENPVRVGAPVTFTEPVIIDYRFDTWKLNPTSEIIPGQEPVEFKNTRESAPKVAGDITVAGFNVLNYFPTTAEDWVAAGNTCTTYKDRDGNPITANSCSNNGPRGAANLENFKRQEAKIVAAINELDASVVGLMEIENSASLGLEADAALKTLVGALNSAAGEQKWAYVGSSTDLPDVGLQDVITNAIIYQPDEVTLQGDARALGTLSATGQAFGNAREPLAQTFVPAGGGKPFMAVVNHFKSKGSGSGINDDQGDGQAKSNPDRIRQAQALTDWVGTLETETNVEDIALIGDFNSYTQEDPMQVFYSAGFTNAVQAFVPDKQTYNFGGLNGSLDHILYSNSMKTRVTGGDTWNVNAPESIALEYSRYNNHGALYYESNAFRSSDHDPVVIGLKKGLDPKFKEFNLLGINDFHGRIDKNTVAFAGTIEEARAQYPDNTLLVAAGDNIGASLFASSVQQDNATIDVLNALEMDAAAVGNHEFDAGFNDLINRVQNRADFTYLGANVYNKGTTKPALPEFEVFELDGITFGVIGAVTQETHTLVTPGGIANLDFGDPVDAVNRVATQLTDGDPTNGEADILLAVYHEGATNGETDQSTLEAEVAKGGVFKKIVNETSPEVAVLFTGHTHKQYAWIDEDAVPGRPVIQTGNYGEFVGQSVITVDTTDNTVVQATAVNIPRSATDKADLIRDYARVAEVDEIVTAALAYAEEAGSVEIGTITADITTAFAGEDAEYVDGVWTGGQRDDRGAPSALSNLVADSLRDSLSDPGRGGADFGVVNPGGLRADLLYAKSGAETKDGVVTFAEANSVLPFVNNLWTTTLTGAQVKTMLEQQWQRNDKGEIPSRDYLQLGLSDNIRYTFDATREEGDRITSITINGGPIDPAKTYVVGTFSFLAQGGDNFHVFKDGTGTRDSGLIDRDAWMDYLEANQNLSPSFARSGVVVPQIADKAKVGDVVEFPVSALNMTSLGSPENTKLVATFMKDGKALGQAVGTFDVTDGATTVKFTVPDGAAGADSLQLVATESGTTVTLAMAVATVDDGGNGDGDGGTGDGDGKTDGGKDKDDLAKTGADVLLPATLAFLLLGAGAYTVIQRRRKA
ncbi:ExeM/NucH family extracellular endonuclease [Jonesiaceae bacterium BS-20]|uniref:ExeM/NucH family extracellular endonuclease n=1 Tax=Jonesiaceae bacterium BS-20 TaxID=3120821 RepID=A0AAU7DZI4_9MICO